MYSETYRPNSLENVIGHADAKQSLKNYLTSSNFPNAIMLTGSPGIGKTTLALSAALSLGFDPLEINASRSIRSYEDVEKIKDACRSAVSIHSFIRGEPTKKTCVILDEVDGSDPHAQSKIVLWIKDPERKVPIICTGNDLPTIFKRNADVINIIRCFPPKAEDIASMLKADGVTEDTVKECQYDIRKILHRIQYGTSDVIPKYSVPPTGLAIETAFVLKQQMFGLEDPLREYHVYKQDTLQTLKTSSQRKNGGRRVRTDECGNH